MRVKIQDYYKHNFRDQIDVDAEHEVLAMVNEFYHLKGYNWQVPVVINKRCVDIIEEPVYPKRIATVKPECRQRYLESFGQTEFEVGYIEGESMGIKTKYFDPTKHTTHDYQVLVKDFDIVGKTDKLDIQKEYPLTDFGYQYNKLNPVFDPKSNETDFTQELLEAFPLSQQMKDLGFKDRNVFWPMEQKSVLGNKLDSAKLHKDISSTVLSVLSRNEKINQLSGRELLSLVGEIADEVVKDVENCKSPPLFDYRPFQGKPIEVEFQNDKLNQK